jgi:succinoglycan biosynthesis protein ExoA
MSVQSHPLSSAARKSVLVVVPCFNEETHIEQVVTALAAEADHIDLRVVVADGGSTDRTCQIITQMMLVHPNVILLNNPRRIQAAGINAAVQRYGDGTEFLVRADAHASYPKRFCESLLKVQASTKADSVVVSMRAVGSTCFQRASAAAQNSFLGNGGSAHRNATSGRWVDHGHHALMTIEAFRTIGGYDETFSHNEDAELDNRLTSDGWRIYLTGSPEITYYPRRSVAALFRQYYYIGIGRARNLLKHRKNAKLRHLVLAGVIPALGLAVLEPISIIFVIPALAWASLCIGYGIILGARHSSWCAAAAGFAAMAMQIGWSIGFFRGLLAVLLQANLRPAPRRPTAHQK